MSRKREMPDGGAKSVLSDLRFGRFVGRIRREAAIRRCCYWRCLLPPAG
ncbi:hypothetical protein LTSEWAN_0366 [Salmonella enterica subsp. enterica serovar Wandsworth str. A4-580]|uniref:Uncharacterized protein n=1 Tax=Salmonella enterica subsp. enterica serovar Wandsworth str. A4-580 TaxID=913086 RepID=G5S6H8_SALET|nr:hypothetical protein LTSEWAN_0366 [Salmonella enterica subsp. enterica serovar Wandsworth str. A4-580]